MSMDNIFAKMLLIKNFPEARPQAWTKYNDLFIFRVKHPFPGEEDYDPFFSVDSNTGEVRDFSVIEDITPDEILNLTWTDILEGR